MDTVTSLVPLLVAIVTGAFTLLSVSIQTKRRRSNHEHKFVVDESEEVDPCSKCRQQLRDLQDELERLRRHNALSLAELDELTGMLSACRKRNQLLRESLDE